MAAMLHDFVRTHVCRAHAPASHATCHDDHENSNAWFSNFLCSHEPMGLRSAALRAAVELRYETLETRTRTNTLNDDVIA